MPGVEQQHATDQQQHEQQRGEEQLPHAAAAAAAAAVICAASAQQLPPTTTPLDAANVVNLSCAAADAAPLGAHRPDAAADDDTSRSTVAVVIDDDDEFDWPLTDLNADLEAATVHEEPSGWEHAGQQVWPPLCIHIHINNAVNYCCCTCMLWCSFDDCWGRLHHHTTDVHT